MFLLEFEWLFLISLHNQTVVNNLTFRKVMQRKTNDHPAGKNVLLNSEYTDTRTETASLIINCNTSLYDVKKN